MDIGKIKSSYDHQGALRVALVGCDDGEPPSICLCQSEGGLSFQFSIDPDEIEHFVDMLRMAARVRLENVKGAA